MTKLKITDLPPGSLKPYDRNARTHSPKQIAQIAASIKAFGFNNPVLVDKDNVIIAGHGRVEAAKQLGLETVPVLRLEHLSEEQKRAYILADNRLAEKAGWDREILKIELQHLVQPRSRFRRLDHRLRDGRDRCAARVRADAGRAIRPMTFPPIEPGPAVTRLGDIWQIGRASPDLRRLRPKPRPTRDCSTASAHRWCSPIRPTT